MLILKKKNKVKAGLGILRRIRDLVPTDSLKKGFVPIIQSHFDYYKYKLIYINISHINLSLPKPNTNFLKSV